MRDIAGAVVVSGAAMVSGGVMVSGGLGRQKQQKQDCRVQDVLSMWLWGAQWWLQEA